MKLITEEELLQEAEKHGVIAKRCTVPDPKNAVIIEGTVYDLLELASLRKCFLFYAYTYPDRGDVLIDHETIKSAWLAICSQDGDDEHEGAITETLATVLYGRTHPEKLDSYDKRETQKAVKKLTTTERSIIDDCVNYNEAADSDLLNKPIAFIAFVPVEGFAVTVMSEVDDIDSSPAQDAARKILRKYKNELVSQYDEAEHKEAEQETTLRLMLLRDSEFLKCTNQHLRKRYAENLWKKNKWIRDMFNPFSFYLDEPNGRCISFIESVWAEYRTDKTIVDHLDDPSK